MQHSECGTVELTQRWLLIISAVGSVASVMTALSLAEKWGENQLGIVSSLFTAHS